MFNISQYTQKIDCFYDLMKQHSHLADIQLSEETWTLKEMVSHLIDSASNNHQRFIRLQLETTVQFPAYGAEAWKQTSKINGYDFTGLINLWKEYNHYLLHIIHNIGKNCLDNIWETEEKQLTLRFLVEDYFETHMNWHMELYRERITEITNARTVSGS